MKRVLFVCMGNICRSPTAEAVVRSMLLEAGLQGEVEVASAGTLGDHFGHPPDDRAQLHAKRRGYDLARLRAKQVKKSDFSDFDLVLAMDRANLATLQRICPAAERHKLGLFLEFADAQGEREIPDPFGGGEERFERVLDLVEEGARGLLRKLHHDQP